MIKTAKFRIKDKNTSKLLDLMTIDVNFVWNVLNAASRKKWKESRQYFHKFDPWVNAIINGASKEFLINSGTIRLVRDQIHKDLRQQKKQLRFRGKKSTGWIPFECDHMKISNGKFKYKKINFRFWDTFKINGKLKTGSFTRDASGKWFVSFNYECEIKKSLGSENTGIDLGLKTAATCSNGKELNLKEIKRLDRKIAKQQQARNFKRVKALHVKKTNIRNDKMNKFVIDLVKTNNLIAIGNVQGFTKGRLAKSRYLNSWSKLKNKLEFKCKEYQVIFKEVDEHLTTQTCNSCGNIEGPKGIKELCVRSWVCSCGVQHNRDINAAINILDRARTVAS